MTKSYNLSFPSHSDSANALPVDWVEKQEVDYSY